MSKITFRADDDLVRQLEEYDASKSEVMREALRSYLGAASDSSGTADVESIGAGSTDAESIDDLIADRIDELVADRLTGAFTPGQPRDINVNITLDGDSVAHDDTDADQPHTSERDVSRTRDRRKTPVDDGDVATSEREVCAQCGENIAGGHVYCPNCGEKASHRVFCECGDELRSDWGFCPSCGRRTPAADVLDQT